MLDCAADKRQGDWRCLHAQASHQHHCKQRVQHAMTVASVAAPDTSCLLAGLLPAPCLQSDFDTFGTAAAAAVQQQAAEAASSRPSAIPGAAPQSFFAPVASSIGIRLLQLMGWRAGRGIGSALPATGPAAAAGRSSKWGTISGVSIDNTPVYVLEPKEDLHGLGYDPFAGAAVFAAARKRKLEEQRGTDGTSLTAAGAGQLAEKRARQRGVAFGTGVLEEDDVMGLMEDYVEAEGPPVGRRQEMFAWEDRSESGGCKG